ISSSSSNCPHISSNCMGSSSSSCTPISSSSSSSCPHLSVHCSSSTSTSTSSSSSSSSSSLLSARWHYALIKRLNFILRHGAPLFGLFIREDGFVRVRDLLMLPCMQTVTWADLQDV